MRVEDHLAIEVFSHCYVAQSVDVKRDVNAVIDKFGLGLRKKRVNSQPSAGCVFVLVNHGGPSSIMQKRAVLPAHDRKLSTEERVKRTSLRFEVVDMKQLCAA